MVCEMAVICLYIETHCTIKRGGTVSAVSVVSSAYQSSEQLSVR